MDSFRTIHTILSKDYNEVLVGVDVFFDKDLAWSVPAADLSGNGGYRVYLILDAALTNAGVKGWSWTYGSRSIPIEWGDCGWYEHIPVQKHRLSSPGVIVDAETHTPHPTRIWCEPQNL